MIEKEHNSVSWNADTGGLPYEADDTEPKNYDQFSLKPKRSFLGFFFPSF